MYSSAYPNRLSERMIDSWGEKGAMARMRGGSAGDGYNPSLTLHDIMKSVLNYFTS
jgi:hypothetical protein